MPCEVSIERDTGSLRIGDIGRLTSGQSKADVLVQLEPFVRGERDHRNGYVWLRLDGLTFGGRPAFLALCFHNDRLTEVGWSAKLPGVADGWPNRKEIDEEVAFVRKTLVTQIGFKTSRSAMKFRWGEVWSSYDPRGGQASNGLRYARKFAYPW